MIYTDVCVILISVPLEREITLDPPVMNYWYFYWVLLFMALSLSLCCFCPMQVVKQFTPVSNHPNTVVVKREMRVNGAKHNRPKLPSTQQYYSINQFLCTFTYNFIKICLENYYPNEKALRGLLQKLQNYNEILIFLMLLKIPISIKLQEIFFLNLFWAISEVKYKMVYWLSHREPSQGLSIQGEATHCLFL